MNKLYVQYGCGLSAPEQWVNFDVSPTLKIQRLPVIGSLLKSRLNAVFPTNVRYGDIIAGLPVADNSCDGLYCSHVLEHLSLEDFRLALKNSYRVLKSGGVFRCIVPDLEQAAREYLHALDSGDDSANIDFIETTMLGIKTRPKGLKNFVTSYFGNQHHLWMWDRKSLAKELQQAGFRDIRICGFNDSCDEMFRHVEDKSRFVDAVAIECRK